MTKQKTIVVIGSLRVKDFMKMNSVPGSGISVVVLNVILDDGLVFYIPFNII